MVDNPTRLNFERLDVYAAQVLGLVSHGEHAEAVRILQMIVAMTTKLSR